MGSALRILLFAMVYVVFATIDNGLFFLFLKARIENGCFICKGKMSGQRHVALTGDTLAGKGEVYKCAECTTGKACAGAERTCRMCPGVERAQGSPLQDNLYSHNLQLISSTPPHISTRTSVIIGSCVQSPLLSVISIVGCGRLCIYV